MSTPDAWLKITRGCAEIISEELLKTKLAKNKPLNIKLGVDPTAPDLHLGHLVVLRKLKAFQELGHNIQFLIGDFTARIGDPSGQSATRPTLLPKEIWEHAKTYQEQVFRVLDREKTEVRHNSTWLNALGIGGLLELLKRTSVAQMLQRADFAERYANGRPISLLELVYPILQGYDSVAVQADVELGGTDQKFNLLMGRELQAEYKHEPQVVMMMPLLEGLDGVRKMSKSYGNYVAFNDTPKDKFGKLMSIPDAMLPKYTELLTDLDVQHIRAMHPREAKEAVAKEIIKFFDGAAAAEQAADEFRRVFTNKQQPQEIPEHRLSSSEKSLIDAMVESKVAASKSEARRLLTQGAVEVDGVRKSERDSLTVGSTGVLVQVGKRRYVRLLPPAQ